MLLRAITVDMMDVVDDERARRTSSIARRNLGLPRGVIEAPAFLPDGTSGVVRSLDAGDLEACGVQAIVMNTFHLMQRPGSSTVQALGGLHAMAGWRRPIVTDSGGFQAYSLIRQNRKHGRLTDRGISFRPDGSDRAFQLTPEKTVQLQLAYGADVVICLDDCTHVDDPPATQEESVRRTVAWARRCKREFERIVAEKRLDEADRPLLFAVIQGGGSLELRKRCACALLDIGFDGYGFGGWPLDSSGNLLIDLLGYTRELVPQQIPMHALGVGHPTSIVAGAMLGYELFDSALPTRDARSGRLYAGRWEAASRRPDWFDYNYIQDDRFIKDSRPVLDGCDCRCCARYARGYLRHLFDIKDTLAFRLATIHNLRFMSRLTEQLRAAGDAEAPA